MKQLSNTEAELQKNVAYKKKRVIIKFDTKTRKYEILKSK